MKIRDSFGIHLDKVIESDLGDGLGPVIFLTCKHRNLDDELNTSVLDKSFGISLYTSVGI